MIDAVSVELVRTRTADGVLLHGALMGRGATAGMLVVHGAWGSFYGTPVFDLLAPAAARGLAALSLNNRGHDLGSLGDGEPCIGLAREKFEDCPLDVEAAHGLLCDSGTEELVVVAHSFGSHKVSYWMAERRPPRVRGLALLSPGPRLQTTERWFVDGSLDDHLARAEAALAEGQPNRLIVLSSSAPVPMVAEAATVRSIWGHGTLADGSLHLGGVEVPVLVTVGEREPAPYRAQAEKLAAAAPRSELVVMPDDHYYSRDRAGMVEVVFDWMERHHLLSLPTDATC